MPPEVASGSVLVSAVLKELKEVGSSAGIEAALVRAFAVEVSDESEDDGKISMELSVDCAVLGVS